MQGRLSGDGVGSNFIIELALVGRSADVLQQVAGMETR